MWIKHCCSNDTLNIPTVFKLKNPSSMDRTDENEHVGDFYGGIQMFLWQGLNLGHLAAIMMTAIFMYSTQQLLHATINSQPHSLRFGRGNHTDDHLCTQ